MTSGAPPCRVWQKPRTGDELKDEMNCKPATTANATCTNRVRYSPGVKSFVWSSIYSDHPNYALPQIGSDDAWLSKNPGNKEDWLQIDAGKKTTIYGFSTQGRKPANEWVSAYTATVSDDGFEWRDVECGKPSTLIPTPFMFRKPPKH